MAKHWVLPWCPQHRQHEHPWADHRLRTLWFVCFSLYIFYIYFLEVCIEELIAFSTFMSKGFLDRYNPDHICNGSDDSGRYSFKNQVRGEKNEITTNEIPSSHCDWFELAFLKCFQSSSPSHQSASGTAWSSARPSRQPSRERFGQRSWRSKEMLVEWVLFSFFFFPGSSISYYIFPPCFTKLLDSQRFTTKSISDSCGRRLACAHQLQPTMSATLSLQVN